MFKGEKDECFMIFGRFKPFRVLFIAVLLVCLSLGCLKQGSDFSYKRVFVGYAVSGGPVTPQDYTTEYLLNNTHFSFSHRYSNGTVSFYRNRSVSADEFARVGKVVVDNGILGMSTRYSPVSDALVDDKAEATLSVNIDGKNKTVVVKPYIEEYAPGNLQKVVFELKSLAQDIQS